MTFASGRPVVALSGGIGGAKLALGLSRVLGSGELTVVANTGDDFDHLGLRISPDLDTLLYTLSGLNDHEKGWGRRDETWTFMTALGQLGGDTWFNLGDGDLATHVERTKRLASGDSLSRVMDDFRKQLGITARLLPMTDDPVRTCVRTAESWLDFQDYFVRQRCAPVVREIRYEGADRARAQPDIVDALADPRLRAVIICPSNPMLSIDPLLGMPWRNAGLHLCGAPIVAVSPIIAGQAVKGPTAKLMRELGVDPSATEVARWYGDLLDGYVIDSADTVEIEGLPVSREPTLMVTLEDRERVARHVLAFADGLSTSGGITR